MKYSVRSIPYFDKEFKRLVKRYPSLKAELAKLGSELEINPTEGIKLGQNCYKIRIAIASKGKGKSGGGRIITHVYVEAETVYLLSIYDKSERSTISDSELKLLLESI
ncbi:MAG: type II toxin-antitoxin system RelE/ParE family toxin [Cytophagales bacterium]|nr:type II toxin-antitoxin system RelE/ParE family toxin [Cytophagales bacterium]